jgi:hypothetical protein
MKTTAILIAAVGLCALAAFADSTLMVRSGGQVSLFDPHTQPLIALVEGETPVLRLQGHSYGGLKFLHNGYGGTAIGSGLLASTDGAPFEFWIDGTGPARWLVGPKASGNRELEIADAVNGYAKGAIVRFRGRLTADPSAPTTGEIYRNTGTGKVRLWDGTAWVDLN